MASIFDLVEAPAVAAYWAEANSERVPYLGETLFPAKKQLGMDLSWIKGHKGLPVALKPSNFDAKATVRDRIGVNEIDTEMPFFREAMKLKEKDRQELLKLQQARPEYYQTFVQKIYDDAGNLIEGALVQPERMRMQLLSQGGKINISTDDGVDYVYDFDQSGDYARDNTVTLTGADMWSDVENSNPIRDLQDAKDVIETQAGTFITRGIMSRRTWSYLLQNKSIKMDMDATSSDKIILTSSMLEQYLLGKVGIQFAIYSKKYEDENGVEQSFYPDGKVSLLPDGNIGGTYFGTTPEEADLMSGSDSQVSIVHTGVAVTTYKEVHPVNINTVVSEIVLPSFERMNETYLMNVYA